MRIAQPSKEVIRSLERQWSEHAQAWMHTNSYFNKSLCNDRAAGESTESTVRKQILTRRSDGDHRHLLLLLLLLHQTACLSRSPRQSCRSSRAAFCDRGCMLIPEQLVMRWGITGLVTAACATSHMIPTDHPLFQKLSSDRESGRKLKIDAPLSLKMQREFPNLPQYIH